MYPDFLCIGAQKSGTTWLHDNLAQHPQIWLPPVKEIHYFDRPYDSPIARLFGRAVRLRKARQHLRRTVWRFAKGGASAEDLSWAVRYAWGRRSDSWYSSLFQQPSGALTGEICPGYARLSPEAVRHIGRLMPEAKIIYLLRHPIERAWSAAVMHFNDRGPRDYRLTDQGEIEDWLRRPKTLEHAGYAEAIERWRSVFGERMFIGFYDELRGNPVSLLERIQRFLGVREYLPEDVRSQRNPGNWAEIPDRFVPVLEQLFAEELRRLHGLMGSPFTLDWLNRRYGTGSVVTPKSQPGQSRAVIS
jgi:hypothetical protein